MQYINNIPELLKDWEAVYKKGQLTFWVLLSLYYEPQSMKDIKRNIAEMTNDTITVDDISMYRALKRYKKAGFVSTTLTPTDNGPDRKIFTLTEIGGELLYGFINKNIVGVLYDPKIMNAIKGVKNNA